MRRTGNSWKSEPQGKIEEDLEQMGEPTGKIEEDLEQLGEPQGRIVEDLEKLGAGVQKRCSGGAEDARQLNFWKTV